MIINHKLIKMKKLFIILCLSHTILYSQSVKYLKYEETIKQVSDNLTLRVEKIKDNLYLIEGLGAGMGNIGLFVSDFNRSLFVKGRFSLLPSFGHDFEQLFLILICMVNAPRNCGAALKVKL